MSNKILYGDSEIDAYAKFRLTGSFKHNIYLQKFILCTTNYKYFTIQINFSSLNNFYLKENVVMIKVVCCSNSIVDKHLRYLMMFF